MTEVDESCRPERLTMADELKAQHDQLLATQPEGLEHDAQNCVFCSANDNNNNEVPRGGDMNTYTEDELTSAVKEAVAPVQAELDALRNSLAEGELEDRIATARAELEEQVSALQASLDAAEIRATEAEQSRDQIVAWLEAEAAAVVAAAELEARKEARRAAIGEISSLSEEYVEANIDRWTAMDDEAFEALVEGLKEVATAARQSELPVGLPAETAMARSASSTNSGRSATAEVFELMRDANFDPRSL